MYLLTELRQYYGQDRRGANIRKVQETAHYDEFGATPRRLQRLGEHGFRGAWDLGGGKGLGSFVWPSCFLFLHSVAREKVRGTPKQARLKTHLPPPPAEPVPLQQRRLVAQHRAERGDRLPLLRRLRHLLRRPARRQPEQRPAQPGPFSHPGGAAASAATRTLTPPGSGYAGVRRLHRRGRLHPRRRVRDLHRPGRRLPGGDASILLSSSSPSPVEHSRQRPLGARRLKARALLSDFCRARRSASSTTRTP